MVGKRVEIKCSECGNNTIVHFGCTEIFEDELGRFGYNGTKCVFCEHILQSERIKSSTKVGFICY